MVPIGEGVFETLLVVDSRPQALTRHLDRLRAAAGRLGLEPPDETDLRGQIAAHLRADPLPYGRMRLSLVADGEGALIAIDSAPAAMPQASVTLTLSEWRLDPLGPLAGLKSTQYADYLAALRAAQLRGFDEALLATTAGHLCEATTANVFFVHDGALCTPALTTGCLPGIARALVIELADVAEVQAPLAALADASEVFLTSSLRAVQPVSRIDRRTYPALGPITADLQQAWRRRMAAEYENDERVR